MNANSSTRKAHAGQPQMKGILLKVAWPGLHVRPAYLQCAAILMGLALGATAIAGQNGGVPDYKSGPQYYGRRQYSLKQTPVDIVIGSVTYHVPRDFIVELLPGHPTLAVTSTSFEPYSDMTQDCLRRPWRNGSQCGLLELRLRLPYSGRDAARQFLVGLRPKRVAKLPGGYTRIDIGPDQARIEVYLNDAERIYARCILSRENDPAAVCEDTVTLDDGNSVSFFFPRPEVADLGSIEIRIRELMARFTEKERGE